jgi:hypothetical protein
MIAVEQYFVVIFGLEDYQCFFVDTPSVCSFALMTDTNSFQCTDVMAEA